MLLDQSLEWLLLVAEETQRLRVTRLLDAATAARAGQAETGSYKTFVNDLLKHS